MSTLVSVFSGYSAGPVPIDILWQFSPLGLLTQFNPDFFEIPTAPGYLGEFGYTFDYLVIFLKTCALESGFYYIIFKNKGWAKVLSAILVCNFLTHPIVFFVFPMLFPKYIPMLIFAEVFAPAVEVIAVLVLRKIWTDSPSVIKLQKTTKKTNGRFFSRPSWPLSVLLVILANLFSWQIGLLLWN